MQVTSPEFNAALESNVRQWDVYVSIIRKGQVIAYIRDGILEGAVRFSNTAIRRTCRFSFVDVTGEFLPVDDHAITAPRGDEFRVRKGLTWRQADGTLKSEYVSLGTFVITETNVLRTEGGGAVIEMAGSDRAEAIRRRLFRVPYVVADGTSVADAISGICLSRYDTPINMVEDGDTTPELLYDIGDDPWSAVQEIAQGANQYAYYDPDGVLTTRRNNIHGGEPTGVTYRTTDTKSMVLDVQRSILSDNVYSGVIIHVEHPDRDPIHAEVWDEDPESATYILGPFGRQPLYIETTTIKTQAQADRLADHLVHGVVAGFGTKVVHQRQAARLTTIGHPGHDVGDRVRVHDEATKTQKWWAIIGGSVPITNGTIELDLLAGVGQEGASARVVIGDPEATMIVS